MFENFYKDVIKNASEPQAPVSINIADNPVFNVEALYKGLDRIETLTEKELYELLKAGHTLLLEDIFKADTPKYWNLLKNAKFLTSFIQVLSNVPLDYNHKVYCNKLAYDYLVSGDTSDNSSYLKQLYHSLSRIVNRNEIPALIGLGISEDLASYMALARYSSLKEYINVKRLNFIIVSSSGMTEQMIVWIYEKLFNRITPLFEGTMFDILAEDEEEQYSEDMLETYGNISLAILDLLNAMPKVDIRKVLISFEGAYRMIYQKSRFPMKSIAKSDYSRIVDVIDALEEEKIYVP